MSEHPTRAALAMALEMTANAVIDRDHEIARLRAENEALRAEHRDMPGLQFAPEVYDVLNGGLGR